MSDHPPQEPLETVDPDRRRFLKKLAIGGFTVPVVTTFSLTQLTPVFVQAATASGKPVTTTAAPPATTTAAPTTTPAPVTTTTTTTTTSPPIIP